MRRITALLIWKDVRQGSVCGATIVTIFITYNTYIYIDIQHKLSKLSHKTRIPFYNNTLEKEKRAIMFIYIYDTTHFKRISYKQELNLGVGCV